MSYDLELYFRSADFPEREWLEILALLNPSMNWWVATFLERPLNPPQVRDFESPRVPQNEGLGGKFISLFSNAEILSWFDAIEMIVEPEDLKYEPCLRRKWFIQVGGYGVFCSLRECHPRYHFEDDKAHWKIFIGTGSGLGLRQFFGYTLCYCALSLIPETSAWDLGEYFDVLYQKPDKFLRKVNAIINSQHLYKKHKRRLEMQQMGVMDENFHLIPDPHVLKLAAQNDLYDLWAFNQPTICT